MLIGAGPGAGEGLGSSEGARHGAACLASFLRWTGFGASSRAGY